MTSSWLFLTLNADERLLNGTPTSDFPDKLVAGDHSMPMMCGAYLAG